ncbi:MAG: ATP-binding cassette domain-containing protein, partial [Acidimicrobiales bacterium]
MSGDPPLLEVSDLTVSFPGAGGPVRAVRGVSFTVAAGAVLGVVGESAAGKSATALAVMGLLPAGTRVGGSVRLAGRELLGVGERALRAVRGRDMAMVFQDPTSSLNPVYTVGWQIAEAVLAHQDVT